MKTTFLQRFVVSFRALAGLLSFRATRLLFFCLAVFRLAGTHARTQFSSLLSLSIPQPLNCHSSPPVFVLVSIVFISPNSSNAHSIFFSFFRRRTSKRRHCVFASPRVFHFLRLLFFLLPSFLLFFPFFFPLFDSFPLFFSFFFRFDFFDALVDAPLFANNPEETRDPMDGPTIKNGHQAWSERRCEKNTEVEFRGAHRSRTVAHDFLVFSFPFSFSRANDIVADPLSLFAAPRNEEIYSRMEVKLEKDERDKRIRRKKKTETKRQFPWLA